MVRPDNRNQEKRVLKINGCDTAFYPAQTAQTIRDNTNILLNETKTKLGNLTAGQVVVIEFGYIHQNGTMITQATDIINELAQNNIPTAVGFELPTNNIEPQLQEIVPPDRPYKTAFIETLKQPEHAASQDYFSAQTIPVRTSNSRLSRAILHTLISNLNIKHFCSDAMRNWETIDRNNDHQHLLDSDPLTAQAIDKALEVLHENHTNIIIEKPYLTNLQLGQLARNFYGIARTEQFSRDNPEIRVIFQLVGRSHVHGMTVLDTKPDFEGAPPKESIPYAHSLHALFTEMSHYKLIGAPVYHEAEDKALYTPKEALLAPNMLWSLKQLPDLKFNSSLLGKLGGDMLSDQNENLYNMDMSKHFNWIENTLNGLTPQKLRDQFFQNHMNELNVFRKTYVPSC